MIRLLAVFAGIALAQETTPADVVSFLRSLSTALANAHDEGSAREFLDYFDPAMPGYATLRDQVESLTARAEVGCAIEVASESGDAHKRVMELDWVLEIQDRPPRRKLVKCTIEKTGKKWKIISFDPVDFFKD